MIEREIGMTLNRVMLAAISIAALPSPAFAQDAFIPRWAEVS
jgi:hypothetical protein